MLLPKTFAQVFAAARELSELPESSLQREAGLTCTFKGIFAAAVTFSSQATRGYCYYTVLLLFVIIMMMIIYYYY